MMKLRRLTIHQFMQVQPGTILFNDGYNVLLGRNGTGKTSLLKLITAVISGNVKAYESIPFKLEWELGLDDHSLVMTASSTGGSDSEYSGPEHDNVQWNYSMTFSGPFGMTVYECRSDGHFGVDPSQEPQEIRWNDLFSSDILTQIASRLFTTEDDWAPFVNALFKMYRGVGRFDEALGTFDLMCGSGPSEYDSPPVAWHVVAKSAGGARLDYSMLFPRSIDTAMSQRIEKSDWEPQFASDDWPELGGMAKALGCQRLAFTSRFQSSTNDDGEIRAFYLGFDVRVTFDDGSAFTASRLSFGQKRLLSFLYYLSANPHFVIADELVNGLHWEWIHTCVSAIGSRQSFLTSQNPLLLDQIPLGSSEAAAQTFIQCIGVPGKAGTAWSWRNLGNEHATDLWEAYEVGIQQVAEILRSRGMW
jgi:energy-coupling factor transporter ATP-binding protein EcfA2